ncbi:MAG TPA: hypothetical protein PLO13_08820, partial [Anaerolineaceae bacterium]|nr:hypothetical protein [Anaerolineaceae bacterium]
ILPAFFIILRFEAGRAQMEALKTLSFGHIPCFQFAGIESSNRRIGDGQMDSKYQTLSSPLAPAAMLHSAVIIKKKRDRRE